MNPNNTYDMTTTYAPRRNDWRKTRYYFPLISGNQVKARDGRRYEIQLDGSWRRV